MESAHKIFVLLIFFTGSLSAQVAIGTTTPNASALFDLTSDNKGLLIPRLSTVQRDLVVLPATGLMIYNTTTNDAELNNGSPEIPSWNGTRNNAPASLAILSVTENAVASTSSVENISLPGMTLSPLAGNYLLLLNAQMLVNATTFSIDQGNLDVNALYSNIINMPATDTHDLVFGSGEILLPGIYDVGGAASIAGTLQLDGNGNPNSIFIIRSSGAFTTGAAVIVELINGATANNVFWVAEGAISTGAGTVLQGILLSHGMAVSLGANSNLEGRMFTTAGAVSIGASSFLVAPASASPIPLGVLSTFVMYTTAGAISGCSDCGITGNVGTGVGAATVFDNINGTVYVPGETNPPVTTIVTYSIFVGGNEVAQSSRAFNSTQTNIAMQNMIVVAEGDEVEIHWKVDNEAAIIGQRTLSLIRSN